MARVHPGARGIELGDSGSVAFSKDGETAQEEAGAVASVLTVWRRSLLLNGNGFTVFDAKGKLVFRVDNYASGSRTEVVLMDGVGEPLLTVRRKRSSIALPLATLTQKLSLGEQWMIYEGEDRANPRFVVKRHLNPLYSRALARVTPCASDAKSCQGYKVEGSYAQRRCAILDDERQRVVEMKRKESAKGVSFGLDVFHLIVQPGFDASVAMTIVLLLEQMFGSGASLLKIGKS
ncbi:protein LURP-one-related 8-like [Zingiber officinale]|uniref:Protein LURP-one-related 8 n=1 Tax=Zingiber officinale TaxID=94328 RepID=A0A8J5GFD8_ZINOF|nr:protein LURP-one-related 8-like [Zingiber officinale]XP_042391770.1 protein LURP-one-related 8-like [Zingiber officinale]XP_042397115.1 protein LURP-one-related 8-like [Zingiber officinale]KAG6503138.1 hypothetical protein ZIOFF_035428 [Zingiber officinale]KAG6506534.1 hypothetical protein ZIOFF_031858 [Zingiber officinale]